MKRLTLVLIGLLLVASGCAGSAQSFAVKIDDIEISEDVVEAEIEAVISNPRSVESLEAQLANLGGLSPGGDNTLSSRYVSQVVYTRVLGALFEREVQRLGLEVNDAAIQEADNALRAGPDAAAFDSFPAGYRDYLVRRQAELAVLIDDRISENKLRDYYTSNSEQFSESCVRHILVATEPEAADIRQQIVDGADFGDIANEQSLDSPTQQGGEPNGGELDCYSDADLQQLVPEFRAAVLELPTNELSQPVETNFGFHVIEVTERNEISFADARADIEAQLGNPNQLFAELLDAAEITVNPRYGTYVPSNPQAGQVGQIVPLPASGLQPDPGSSAGSSPEGFIGVPQ